MPQLCCWRGPGSWRHTHAHTQSHHLIPPREQPTVMHANPHHLKGTNVLVGEWPWFFPGRVSCPPLTPSPRSRQEPRIRVALQLQMKAAGEPQPSYHLDLSPASEELRSSYCCHLLPRPPAVTENSMQIRSLRIPHTVLLGT